MWSKAKRHTANTFLKWNLGESRKTVDWALFTAPSAVELHYSVGYLLHCSQSAVLQNAVIQLHLGYESNVKYIV